MEKFIDNFIEEGIEVHTILNTGCDNSISLKTVYWYVVNHAIGLVLLELGYMFNGKEYPFIITIEEPGTYIEGVRTEWIFFITAKGFEKRRVSNQNDVFNYVQNYLMVTYAYD